MKRPLLIICALLMTGITFAQKESKDVRHGNQDYKKENYAEAETDYRRGLDKNDKSFEAHFNLGDALFKQQKYPEALEEYKQAESLLTNKDKKRLAATYHNMGNAQYAQQKYGDAVEAYKQSLRCNPKDNDTRYNLVKAMQMLQQQQQQQQQDNQDQNQDKQEQQQQQQQEDQQQQQQQQQRQEDQMDKEQAEQILQALEQDEQAAQEKAQRQQMNGGRRAEKDW